MTDPFDGMRDACNAAIDFANRVIDDRDRLRDENARLREDAARDPEVVREVMRRYFSSVKSNVSSHWVERIVQGLCDPPEPPTPERRTGEFVVVSPGGVVGNGRQLEWGFFVRWPDQLVVQDN